MKFSARSNSRTPNEPVSRPNSEAKVRLVSNALSPRLVYGTSETTARHRYERSAAGLLSHAQRSFRAYYRRGRATRRPDVISIPAIWSRSTPGRLVPGRRARCDGNRYQSGDRSEIEHIASIEPRRGGRQLRCSRASRRTWRNEPFERRAALLKAVAARYYATVRLARSRRHREMGKPLVQARAEVEKCAWCLDYFADTDQHCWRRNRRTTARAVTLRFGRSAYCLRSCRGTFPIGKSFARPHRR